MSEYSRQPELLPRAKWWWLGLALLLILAGWLYLRGYNVSLPYMISNGEPQYLLGAQHVIDDGTARAVDHDSYPPGITAVGYFFLKHLRPAGAHHVTMLPALRLTSICAWMIIVALIALLAARLVHPLAGLMAAAIWIVNPWVVERAHFFMPDGFLTMFTLLGLWLALAAESAKRRKLSVIAIYMVMLAAVFKTQAVFVAPVIILLPLARLLNPANSRREVAEDIFEHCVRFAIFSFWYLFLTTILEADVTNPAFPVAYGRFGLPSFSQLSENLMPVIDTIPPPLGWISIALGYLLLYRYRRQVDAMWLLALIASAGAFLFGASLFGTQEKRQFFFIGAALSIFYSLGLMLFVFGLNEALNRLLPHRYARYSFYASRLLPAALVSTLLAISLLPSYRESDWLAHNFSLHDRRNDLATYMDTSLPPGRYISRHANHNTFNRNWGGYDGRHHFPWHKPVAELSDKPISEWRDLDVEYAIMSYKLLNEESYANYTNETVLLKSYPRDRNFRGPDMVVLRLYPMQYTASGQLGPIHLVGYDLNTTQVPPGGDLVIRHYWRADSPTAAPKRVFNHLLDSQGELVAQVDYIPLFDERRDTTTWDDPDEILLRRPFVLTLPADLAPGRYSLTSGFNAETGILQSPDGGDRLVIAEIDVQAPSP